MLFSFACPGAEYNFTEALYGAAGGENAHITLTVLQKTGSLVNIHLLVIPLTHTQYEQRSLQNGSTLAPIDMFYEY